MIKTPTVVGLEFFIVFLNYEKNSNNNVFDIKQPVLQSTGDNVDRRICKV